MRRFLAPFFCLAIQLLIAQPAPAQPSYNFQNILPFNVTCGSSATLVAPYRTRGSITLVSPSGGATVYFGGSGVATSGANEGAQLFAGSTASITDFAGALYCITASSQAITGWETY